MSEANKAAARDNTAAVQRDLIGQQLAGVQARLERKGIGAAFYRAAKADPIGDMGFMGSLMMHALIGSSFEHMIGDHLSLSTGELDCALSLGNLENLFDEAQERQARRPKSAFYPLGRNKRMIKDEKAGKVAGKAISRFCPEVQAELAFMFELMDTLSKMEAKETGDAIEKNIHLTVRQSANPGYNGVERRRRPRPEGLFSA